MGRVVGDKPLVNSLPLMGIGNTTILDEKRQSIIDLITPHGDRERGDPKADAAMAKASLPLMGIGNVIPYGSKCSNWSSLPLMGIGNRPYPRGGRSDLALITPHGDREPSLFLSSTPIASNSLPLMGIGNSGRPRGPGLPCAHYPSWGSGTGIHFRLEMPQSDLITPHGDRELTDGYRFRLDTRDSLPLMGIGNSRWPLPWRWPSPSHYPSWGSGTATLRHRVGLVPDLIIPHGDREHSLPRGGGRREPRLITPHGDRELANWAPTCAARYATHYPSWGSGTCCQDRPQGAWHTPAHYPSWGSGT